MHKNHTLAVQISPEGIRLLLLNTGNLELDKDKDDASKSVVLPSRSFAELLLPAGEEIKPTPTLATLYTGNSVVDNTPGLVLVSNETMKLMATTIETISLQSTSTSSMDDKFTQSDIEPTETVRVMTTITGELDGLRSELMSSATTVPVATRVQTSPVQTNILYSELGGEEVWLEGETGVLKIRPSPGGHSGSSRRVAGSLTYAVKQVGTTTSGVKSASSTSDPSAAGYASSLTAIPQASPSGSGSGGRQVAVVAPMTSGASVTALPQSGGADGVVQQFLSTYQATPEGYRGVAPERNAISSNCSKFYSEIIEKHPQTESEWRLNAFAQQLVEIHFCTGRRVRDILDTTGLSISSKFEQIKSCIDTKIDMYVHNFKELIMLLNGAGHHELAKLLVQSYNQKKYEQDVPRSQTPYNPNPPRQVQTPSVGQGYSQQNPSAHRAVHRTAHRRTDTSYGGVLYDNVDRSGQPSAASQASGAAHRGGAASNKAKVVRDNMENIKGVVSTDLGYFGSSFIANNLVERASYSNVKSMHGVGNEEKAEKIINFAILSIERDPRLFEAFLEPFAASRVYSGLAKILREALEAP